MLVWTRPETPQSACVLSRRAELKARNSLKHRPLVARLASRWNGEGAVDEEGSNIPEHPKHFLVAEARQLVSVRKTVSNWRQCESVVRLSPPPYGGGEEPQPPGTEFRTATVHLCPLRPGDKLLRSPLGTAPGVSTRSGTLPAETNVHETTVRESIGCVEFTDSRLVSPLDRRETACQTDAHHATYQFRDKSYTNNAKQMFSLDGSPI
ncbi:hypothetical protein DPEC_G00270140 [Dallia pectoralis]|uniref:Uncharacterized protein n=1 Tax=Dallia pectoralis TaxID=75939 RepID=A0ACC2FPR9_DALPE|nr:hypothetical protein DPEC_G00270140 [Dallia pectoralis]